MDLKEEKKLLEFAVSIANRSGVIARKYFRSSLKVNSKSDLRFDPVTPADREIESYLRDRIQAQYPDHGIIGEEHKEKTGRDYTWVIDPIDGTRGFISGSPMWGTLVGLMKNRRPVIGLMHQPFIRETFFAGSRGAWLKSGKRVKRMRTSATSEIGDAVLYSTHPSLFSGKGELKAFKNVEGRCRYSRYGSDCYGYCLLASGFADIVIEAGLHAYDIIPLIPVIRSAGGIVTDWNGRQPLNGGRVIAAANRSLHKKAIALLNQ